MLRIDEEYIINATDNCYTLENINTVQDINSKNYGQQIRIIKGYYTSMQGALKGYLKYKMRKYVGQASETTLNDFIKYLNKLENVIKDLVGNV